MIDRAEKQASVRPDSFTNDSVMLDYIQQVHLNYSGMGQSPTLVLLQSAYTSMAYTQRTMHTS